MKKFVELPWYGLACVISLAGLFIYTQFVEVYSDVHGWDYVIYVHASDHVSRGESPYQETLYLYTPLLAILMVPFRYLDRETGYWLWTIISLAAYGYSVFRVRHIGQHSSQYSGSPSTNLSTRDKSP